MSQKEYDIFISYRRVGGADKARILKTELEGRGYKVFLDYDELKDGVFDKRIMDAINSSPIFMFLLTPNSLERCLNEDDWVRKEIEYAVDNHKHFIPINPDCTFTSLPDGLSSKVKEGLGQHQFSDIMFGQLFKASINELIADRIRPVLAEWGRAAAASTNGATVRIETDLDCRILRFGKEIGMAQSGDIAEIKLPKGKHKLRFVGLESENDSYECLLSVEDLEYEDYIEVKLLDKYNARKAKEEAERQRIEAERKAKAEREAYLLSLPDTEFIYFMEDHKYGYKLKSTGEIAVPCKYDCFMGHWYIDYFHEGLAKVFIHGKGCGYIDKTGKEVIPFKYDYAGSFSEGLARVEINGKYGFIDKTGKEVIPFKYDYADSFSEGLARFRLNSKYGYIDKIGREVIPFKYDDAGWFREGLARVFIHGKGWGFIDKTGKEVVPLKYDYVDSFREGLARVRLNGRWGYVDKMGNEVIPLIHNAADNFHEGLARVKVNGKYGFIDKIGKEVIPFKYNFAGYFQEGLACINTGGRIPECYDGATGDRRKFYEFDVIGGQWGFIDKMGKEVISPKYNYADFFDEGLAPVRSNRKWGYIDKTGKEVIPFRYDSAWEFGNGKAKVCLNGEWFYIDKNGNHIKLK